MLSARELLANLLCRSKNLLGYIRLRLYLLLSRPNSSLYDSHIRYFRWGLPLVLKRTDRLVSTEADALRFLNRQLPHLPIPRFLDSATYDGATYTLMTKLPGTNLLDLFEKQKIQEQEMKVVITDIFHFLVKLGKIRQIKRQSENSRRVMLSASGDGLPNPVLFRESLIGPFDSTLDCYAYMARKDSVADLEADAAKLDALAMDPIGWVHTDLRMYNVLVGPNGRLSGIVDWEDSGFLPRHWQLHILRGPHLGCRGSWLRLWRERSHLHFGEDTETAYDVSPTFLVYPL